ncbi:hypothetical protein [Xanthomonas tesorieronis]|uniref:hypothetical protein n=1 Tax=Xanthomonas tesorieronis TaxID=3160839 RepID=UPI0035198130
MAPVLTTVVEGEHAYGTGRMVHLQRHRAIHRIGLIDATAGTTAGWWLALWQHIAADDAIDPLRAIGLGDGLQAIGALCRRIRRAEFVTVTPGLTVRLDTADQIAVVIQRDRTAVAGLDRRQLVARVAIRHPIAKAIFNAARRKRYAHSHRRGT